ncbi:hypothetical protein ADUPG1_008010, partial [Aduncisulcus paluster]
LLYLHSIMELITLPRLLFCTTLFVLNHTQVNILFTSVCATWRAASSLNMADVKELIPEFFYLPSLFTNQNVLNFGQSQETLKPVNDVELPMWAHNSPVAFTRIMRQALESSFCSDELCSWIDLIFGFKQRGPAAHEAVNIFYPLTYASKRHIEGETNVEEKRSKMLQMRYFGLTPKQLFESEAHPHKNRRASSDVNRVNISFLPSLLGVACTASISSFVSNIPALSIVSSFNSSALTFNPEIDASQTIAQVGMPGSALVNFISAKPMQDVLFDEASSSGLPKEQTSIGDVSMHESTMEYSVYAAPFDRGIVIREASSVHGNPLDGISSNTHTSFRDIMKSPVLLCFPSIHSGPIDSLCVGDGLFVTSCRNSVKIWKIIDNSDSQKVGDIHVNVAGLFPYNRAYSHANDVLSLCAGFNMDNKVISMQMNEETHLLYILTSDATVVLIDSRSYVIYRVLSHLLCPSKQFYEGQPSPCSISSPLTPPPYSSSLSSSGPRLCMWVSHDWVWVCDGVFLAICDIHSGQYVVNTRISGEVTDSHRKQQITLSRVSMIRVANNASYFNNTILVAGHEGGEISIWRIRFGIVPSFTKEEEKLKLEFKSMKQTVRKRLDIYHSGDLKRELEEEKRLREEREREKFENAGIKVIEALGAMDEDQAKRIYEKLRKRHEEEERARRQKLLEESAGSSSHAFHDLDSSRMDESSLSVTATTLHEDLSSREDIDARSKAMLKTFEKKLEEYWKTIEELYCSDEAEKCSAEHFANKIEKRHEEEERARRQKLLEESAGSSSHAFHDLDSSRMDESSLSVTATTLHEDLSSREDIDARSKAMLKTFEKKLEEYWKTIEELYCSDEAEKCSAEHFANKIEFVCSPVQHEYPLSSIFIPQSAHVILSCDTACNVKWCCPILSKRAEKVNWISDDDCAFCCGCGVRFTRINRRHHCRCCGYVFCSECSGHKKILPEFYKLRAEKVCKMCFEGRIIREKKAQIGMIFDELH